MVRNVLLFVKIFVYKLNDISRLLEVQSMHFFQHIIENVIFQLEYKLFILQAI